MLCMNALLALAAIMVATDPAWARVDDKPMPAAVPAYRQADTLAVITIRGPIDKMTLKSLERRMAEAVADGAEAVVLDIDTEGGQLVATLDICNLLKDRGDTPINTVAWIHPKAYSAGTIIALACREIVVGPNAAFGDAAPISPFTALPTTERAKVESPILQEVVDSARRHHYDEKLVQSFVAVGVELWLIENVNDGERIFVDRTEYKTVFGTEPPDEMTPVAPSAAAQQEAVIPWINPLMEPPRETGPELTEEDLARELEYAQQLPPSRPALTEADRGQWRLVAQVVTGDRLLTVGPTEAIYYGLATETIADETELAAYFGAATVKHYHASWSEALVRVLVSWPVRIVLIIIFIVALFIELAAPGLGVFGATAGVAFLILFGAPFLIGMAQWWDLLLIVLGLLLVAAELFVIPGLGIAGICGAICLFAGLVGTFVSGDISSPQGQSELWTGLVTTMTAVFGAGVGVWLVSRHFHSLPLLDQLVLKAEVRDRGVSRTPEAGLLESMGAAQRALAVGDVGTAHSDLRPAGRAEINGRMVDVKSVGSYIEKGSPIVVVSVGRFAIEVEDAQ